MFDALVLVAWVAAADCTAVPAVFVVGGGSVNGVSCEAPAEEPA